MTPQPQSLADEIKNFLEELLKAKEVKEVTEVQLARVKFMIDQLAKADLPQSQSLRAVYYYLSGDSESARQWHELSIKTSPSNSFMYANYASVLHQMGKYDEAIEQYEKALSINRSNYDIISSIIVTAYCASRSDILDKWLPAYKALTGREHYVAEYLLEDAEDEAELDAIIAEGAEKGTIPWESVKKELGL